MKLIKLSIFGGKFPSVHIQNEAVSKSWLNNRDTETCCGISVSFGLDVLQFSGEVAEVECRECIVNYKRALELRLKDEQNKVEALATVQAASNDELVDSVLGGYLSDSVGYYAEFETQELRKRLVAAGFIKPEGGVDGK